MDRPTKSVSKNKFEMAKQYTSGANDAMAVLLEAASTFERPSIYQHATVSKDDEGLSLTVPAWSHIRRAMELKRSRIVSNDVKVIIGKPKSRTTGRNYTSRYIGVHQTFPTKRWEAQFRRNGKPTSLGCFDEEEEAARAYDKMKIWCQFHDPKTLKVGTTNFDVGEYEPDIGVLKRISQDDLIHSLRSYGCKQAAERHSRQKRENRL